MPRIALVALLSFLLLASSAAGQLVVRNRNHVERNEVVEVTSTWSIAGDKLEISNAIQAEDGPMVIRRVFRKQ